MAGGASLPQKGGNMFNFDIFIKGSVRLLDRYYCYAEDRETAKAIALKWAQKKYPRYNVRVSSTN